MATSPNTDNYSLGKGVIYFNEKGSDGVYRGERDLGNAPSFAFNIALEKLDHFSSRGGLKSKDKQVISQITPGITFTLDELNKENLAMLSLADVVEVDQVGAAIVAEEHAAKIGKRIVLAARGISSVVVKDKTTGLITYVAGTDYLIDTTLKDDVIGRIYIVPGGAIATAVAAAEATVPPVEFVVEVDYTSATVSYTQIQAFKNTQMEGELRFVSDNPAGTQMELQVWRVALSPAGDTSFIGDDWSTLGFTGEVLKDAVGHPDSPYMDFVIA